MGFRDILRVSGFRVWGLGFRGLGFRGLGFGDIPARNRGVCLLPGLEVSGRGLVGIEALGAGWGSWSRKMLKARRTLKVKEDF